MEEVRFYIETIMQKKDYKRFLYIVIFFKNKFFLPFVGLLAFMFSLIINWESDGIHWMGLLHLWMIYFAIFVIAVCLMVERKCKRRFKTDRIGTFDIISQAKFYDDKVIFGSEDLNSRAELNYNQFFSLLESKDYFIFYYSIDQATLIPKRDIGQLDEFTSFIVEKFDKRYKYIRTVIL